MLSIFGYDAGPPPSKNIGVLFELGYESEPEMAEAVLGYEAHFSQFAPDGVIFSGGRSGSNGPAYIDSVSSSPALHLPLPLQPPNEREEPALRRGKLPIGSLSELCPKGPRRTAHI